MALETTTPSEAGASLDPQQRMDGLLAQLGTRPDGLSSREATRQLAQYGRNELVRRQGTSHVTELARQFSHPLALLVAAVQEGRAQVSCSSSPGSVSPGCNATRCRPPRAAASRTSSARLAAPVARLATGGRIRVAVCVSGSVGTGPTYGRRRQRPSGDLGGPASCFYGGAGLGLRNAARVG
jgi:hypothetical protein